MLASLEYFQSWFVLLISVCVILCAAIFVFLCLCWERKKDFQKHYYVIDENGLHKTEKDSLNNQTLFKQFTKLSKLSTSNLQSIKSEDADLADSLNICKKLDRTILRLEINPLDCEDSEEMLSCKSTDSKFTFYSTHPSGQAANYQDALEI